MNAAGGGCAAGGTPDRFHNEAHAALCRHDADEFERLTNAAAVSERKRRSHSGTKRRRPEHEDYLTQRLSYSSDGSRLLTVSGDAVMMGWEAPLMAHHALAVRKHCANTALDTARSHRPEILNIGFGLGLFDEAVQREFARVGTSVGHTIIEAHPDVLAWAQGTTYCRRVVKRVLVSGRGYDSYDLYTSYRKHHATYRKASRRTARARCFIAIGTSI